MFTSYKLIFTFSYRISQHLWIHKTVFTAHLLLLWTTNVFFRYISKFNLWIYNNIICIINFINVINIIQILWIQILWIWRFEAIQDLLYIFVLISISHISAFVPDLRIALFYVSYFTRYCKSKLLPVVSQFHNYMVFKVRWIIW